MGYPMEKDPQIVARLAAERTDENWQFRTFLKSAGHLSTARLDQLAEQFGRQAESQMDCTTCGACCLENCVPVTADEQLRLARRLGVPQDEFVEKYGSVDDDGEPALDAVPCPFLSGSRCSVYEDRPDACRGYPYIGGEVMPRIVGIIERAGTCPIVFDMLEKLKSAVGFRQFLQ